MCIARHSIASRHIQGADYIYNCSIVTYTTLTYTPFTYSHFTQEQKISTPYSKKKATCIFLTNKWNEFRRDWYYY